MKRPLCICLAISLVLCMALPAAAQEPNEGRAAALHQHFISYLEWSRPPVSGRLR